MSPETIARAAKLLRMLTSSFDGERLAAVDRLNALVIAHGVDWDRALGNGEPALDEEAARRIYQAAFERGVEEGRQQARPARDWTPTGTSAEVGNDYARLAQILSAAMSAADDGVLNTFETEFSDNMLDRLRQYGKSTFVSQKQWLVLDRLREKLTRLGFISS